MIVLIALRQGKLIDAAFAERRGDYCCPACRQHVSLRHGTQVQPYFAHRAKATCTIFSEGETAQHLAGKRQLLAFFAPWGRVSLEHVLPTIQQRADGWIARPTGKAIAIEFQCSPITTKQVLHRTRGYQKLGVYPFWILGQRYSKQKLGWSLIERFATRLRGWGLCLLFWDVQRQRMRIDHHLYQDALGGYHGRTVWLANVADLAAGNWQRLPKLELDYPAWRSRLARDLHLKNAAVLAIQERLYPAGHHVLDVPTALTTSAVTPPVFGQGLLLWRALVASQLLKQPATTISLANFKEVADKSFQIVGGHRRAVWFTAEHALEMAKRRLARDLVASGYLRVTDDGWQVVKQLRWVGESI